MSQIFAFFFLDFYCMSFLKRYSSYPWQPVQSWRRPRWSGRPYCTEVFWSWCSLPQRHLRNWWQLNQFDVQMWSQIFAHIWLIRIRFTQLSRGHHMDTLLGQTNLHKLSTYLFQGFYFWEKSSYPVFFYIFCKKMNSLSMKDWSSMRKIKIMLLIKLFHAVLATSETTYLTDNRWLVNQSSSWNF